MYQERKANLRGEAPAANPHDGQRFLDDSTASADPRTAGVEL